MNSLQSVFADAFFGLLYLIIFDYLLKYNLPIWTIIISLIFVAFYFILAIPLWGRWMETCVNEYKANLSNFIFSSFMKKKIDISRHSSSILSILQEDIKRASEVVGWSLVVLFQAIISGLVSSIAIGLISWKMLIALLITGTIPLILDLKFMPIIRKRAEEIRALIEIKQRKVLDYVNNIIVIKVFHQEDKIHNKIIDTAKKIYEKINRLNKLEKRLESIGELIYSIIFKFIVIIYGMKLVLNGEIGFGAVLFIFSMVEGIVFFTNYIGGYIKNIQKILVAIRNIDRHLELEEEVKLIKDIYDTEKLILDISIENMSYRYKGSDNYLFEKFNYNFEFPKNYIISGKNGSGKSTLLKLLFGFDSPNDGKIKIKSEEAGIKYGKPAYVPQEPFIISGSLREVIGNYNPTINDKDIIKALKSVGLSEWYDNLEEKLNFHIAEKGKNLSKGQQMRIGIARALVKKPQILFLDEPDANLDSETMDILMKEIKKNYSLSIVMVSHIRSDEYYEALGWSKVNLDSY